LQQFWRTEDVFEGTPDVVPTAQDMSEVGKRLKSAVEQGETLVDIVVLWYERAMFGAS
jgi:hypothetical protein